MTVAREITPQSVAVAASSLIATIFSGVTFASIAISVFMVPIAADYHWTRAGIGGAVTFLRLGMAVSAPLFGRLIDRRGARTVLLPLIVASALILAGFSMTGPSLAFFCFAHLMLGLSTPGAAAYTKLLSAWFFRYRGIALATLGFGTLAAKFIIPPVAQYLLGVVGWHGAYLALALAELLISFPVLFLFFRERRVDGVAIEKGQSHEIRPDGAPEIGVRQAIRTATFWLLVGAEAAAFFAFIGISTHAVGILTEHGVSSTLAVWGLSIFAAGGLIAQLLCGYLLDRFDTPRAILPFAIGSVLGLIAVQMAHGEIATLLAFLLFGIGCGGQTTTTSYFTTRFFGVRNYSTIYGVLFPVFLVVSAPAPIVIGAIFDRGHSYGPALLLVDAILTSAIAFIWLLKPYPYPTKPDAAEAMAPVEPR